MLTDDWVALAQQKLIHVLTDAFVSNSHRKRIDFSVMIVFAAFSSQIDNFLRHFNHFSLWTSSEYRPLTLFSGGTQHLRSSALSHVHHSGNLIKAKEAKYLAKKKFFGICSNVWYAPWDIMAETESTGEVEHTRTRTQRKIMSLTNLSFLGCCVCSSNCLKCLLVGERFFGLECVQRLICHMLPPHVGRESEIERSAVGRWVTRNSMKRNLPI